MAFNKTGDGQQRRRPMHRRKKVCVFCGKDNVIDYKDTAKLKKYISERGKILPRRITESSYSSYQACSSRCTYAIRTGLILEMIIKHFLGKPRECFFYVLTSK